MRSCRFACVALSLVCALALNVRSAAASPYYTVVDLGNANYDNLLSNPSSQSTIASALNGASYAFPISSQQYVPSSNETLPGVDGIQGVTVPEHEFFPMHPGTGNVLGTVLGAIPSGASLATPYSELDWGYAIKAPDGQWGPFTVLSQYTNAQLSLNAQNNILITDNLASRLYNVNTGVVTDISQLLSPQTLQMYTAIHPVLLADNGSILADATSVNGGNTRILLSPNDPTPTPVPEPSTLGSLALGLAAFVFASGRYRRSNPARGAISRVRVA